MNSNTAKTMTYREAVGKVEPLLSKTKILAESVNCKQNYQTEQTDASEKIRFFAKGNNLIRILILASAGLLIFIAVKRKKS